MERRNVKDSKRLLSIALGITARTKEAPAGTHCYAQMVDMRCGAMALN